MAPKEKQKIEIEKSHRDPLLSFNQAVTVDCSDFLGTALVTGKRYLCTETDTLRYWSHSRTRRWQSVGFRDKRQLRTEVFNVLNHTNWENPRNATSGSPSIQSSIFA